MRRIIKKMNKKQLMELWRDWKRYALKDPTQEYINISNAIMNELSSNLPFETFEEEEKWNDLCATFKFFEDFEEATMKIINRAK